MNLVDLLLFTGGLCGLLVGGESLVRGASGIARSFGIAPLVVGLTVVAFGTSAPELAVSMASALAGSAPIALGNVVGSNVFNILLVLGGAGVLTRLSVKSQLVRFDVPVMVASSLALAGISLDGTVTAVEAVVLFVSLIGYLSWTVTTALKEKRPADAERAPDEGEQGDEEDDAPGKSDVILAAIAVVAIAWPLVDGSLAPAWGGALVGLAIANSLLGIGWGDKASRKRLAVVLVVGLAMVSVGAHVLVQGAVGIAQSMGISDAVIGLTVVAAGTSAPEAITSFVAARRNQADLAIGNVVGSNIFNVLCIVGLVGTVRDLPVPKELLQFDYPFMLAASLALWPLLWARKSLGRLEGSAMLLAFVGYLGVQLWRVM